ncbi:MAG: structural protein P5 [Rikenellaceae bacterium]|jgi:hypothetical protein|nr:structural protein P5 [Rikenellaceae bacterium]
MSRGLRNNNPGNIRLSGVRYLGEVQPSTDPAFKQFKTIVWGYRAMFVLLRAYEVRHGLRTLRGMIARYAPPGENDTSAYENAVSVRARFAPERILSTLDGSVMIPLVAAMSRVENGVDAVEADVRAGWELFAGTSMAEK